MEGVGLRLRILGGAAAEGTAPAEHGAWSRRKALALLGLLAASGPSGLSRDKILAYLWPESPADRAGHSLRQLLHSLRRELGDEALVQRGADLRLDPRHVTTDLQEFSDALEAGDLERAVSLYRGPFLDGFHPGGSFELEQWVELEREQLAKRFREALESLATEAEKRGDRVSAARWWGRLAAADPFSSRIALRLIESLSAGGDRVAALQAARAYQRRLREELDADPDPDVEAAAERIRRAGPESASRDALSGRPMAAETPVRPGTETRGGAPASDEAPGPRTGAAPVAAIAVLPFVNLSADPDDEYFSDGMTDEIAQALARVPGVRVAARTSAFAFKRAPADARRIGELLGVATLVEGSVRRIGERIRMSAHLVDAASGYQLWSETYDRTLADVFAVQEELSRNIVGALSKSLGERTGTRLVEPPTRNLEAYTHYLRGRFFADKRTADGLGTAVEEFGMALRKDPGYALAHAGLAEAHAMLGFDIYAVLPPPEAMPKALAAATEALRLDPELADAHVWRGVVAFLYEWDWELAETELRRALALRPGSSAAHIWYAVVLCVRGRGDEGVRVALAGRAADPLSVLANVNVGRCFFFVRRYDDALRELALALEMDPAHAQTYATIGRALIGCRRFPEAMAELERGLEVAGPVPDLLALYGVASGAAGVPTEAMRALGELRELAGSRHVSPVYESMVLRVLGRRDEAWAAYERGVRLRSGLVPFSVTEIVNDIFAGDPRLRSFLEGIGLSLRESP